MCVNSHRTFQGAGAGITCIFKAANYLQGRSLKANNEVIRWSQGPYGFLPRPCQGQSEGTLWEQWRLGRSLSVPVCLNPCGRPGHVS